MGFDNRWPITQIGTNLIASSRRLSTVFRFTTVAMAEKVRLVLGPTRYGHN